MDSYFFVPGNKLHKIKSILEIQECEIVIDMEDAVKASEREAILGNLVSEIALQAHYIRVPLYDITGENIDTTLLKKLLQIGYSKFVFPKINSLDDFNLIYPVIEKFQVKIILLVETPRLFLEAKDLLMKYQKCFTGIGIGSHDFMSVVGGIHTLNNLEYLRQQIIYLARMINIVAVDIASMELNNVEELENEIIDGFQKGYDAKFLIHPWQLGILKNLRFYTKEDYEWALFIEEKLKQIGNSKEFNPIVIGGQVIEKPHLQRAKRILKYYKP